MQHELDPEIEIRNVFVQVYGNATLVEDVRPRIEAVFDQGRIPWIPDYLFEAGLLLWGISLFRGMQEPFVRVQRMLMCRSAVKDFVPAFFVPGDENPDIIIPLCMENEIPIIARVGDRYDFLDLTISLPAAPIPHEDRPRYLPSRLLTRIQHLKSLEDSYREPLAEFAKRYLEKTAGASLTHEEERGEILAGVRAILEANPNIAEILEPFEILAWLEQWTQLLGYRDHFFHSFHNLLLGFIVLDEAYDEFRKYARDIMRLPNASLECIWFLAALYHDVGYSVQWGPEFLSARYGLPADRYRHNGELRAKVEEERTAMWELEEYQNAWRALVNLWECRQDDVQQYPWVRDTSFTDVDFADALRDGFINGHGVAGALRLLIELGKIAGREEDQPKRQFWWHHFYQSALAIPFHDAAFREALLRRNIVCISTKRFPFASLLTFVDSIQEDRRGSSELDRHRPDILYDIEVRDAMVVPVIEFQALSDQRLLKKRMEARQVHDFLDCDGLRFIYPEALLGEIDVGCG